MLANAKTHRIIDRFMREWPEAQLQAFRNSALDAEL